MPDDKIRAVGTSWAKAKYVKNVAQAVIDKKLDLENFQNLSDDEIKNEVNEIVEFAKNSPEPDESELMTEIYN